MGFTSREGFGVGILGEGFRVDLDGHDIRRLIQFRPYVLARAHEVNINQAEAIVAIYSVLGGLAALFTRALDTFDVNVLPYHVVEFLALCKFPGYGEHVIHRFMLHDDVVMKGK